MLKRGFLGAGLILLVGGVLTLSAQDRKPSGDPSAATRLKLAREGYATIHDQRGGPQDFLGLSVWSYRIMEAQRDESGNAVAAARDHLDRMKEYIEIVEALKQAARTSQASVLDAQYRVAEAESLLWKAQTP